MEEYEYSRDVPIGVISKNLMGDFRIPENAMLWRALALCVPANTGMFVKLLSAYYQVITIYYQLDWGRAPSACLGIREPLDPSEHGESACDWISTPPKDRYTWRSCIQIYPNLQGLIFLILCHVYTGSVHDKRWLLALTIDIKSWPQ